VLVCPGKPHDKRGHAEDDGQRHADNNKGNVGTYQKEGKNDPEYGKDAYQPFPEFDTFHNFLSWSLAANDPQKQYSITALKRLAG